MLSSAIARVARARSAVAILTRVVQLSAKMTKTLEEIAAIMYGKDEDTKEADPKQIRQYVRLRSLRRQNRHLTSVPFQFDVQTDRVAL